MLLVLRSVPAESLHYEAFLLTQYFLPLYMSSTLNTTIYHGIPNDVFLESYMCVRMIPYPLSILLVLYITVYTKLMI
jgi:hypothetical protein